MKTLTTIQNTSINAYNIGDFFIDLTEKEKGEALVKEADKNKLLKLVEKIGEFDLNNVNHLKKITNFNDSKALEVFLYVNGFELRGIEYSYADILELFLGGKTRKVEKRLRELYLYHALMLIEGELEFFKKGDLENYLDYLKQKIPHNEASSSITELSEKGKELSETGKDRNVLFDFLQDMSQRYNFLFEQNQKHIGMNVKIMNSAMKNKDFIPSEFIVYIKENPHFQTWMKNQMTELNEQNEQIYILWFSCFALFPFFYTGSEIKNIKHLLNWFEGFVYNYESSVNCVQLTTFYFREILGKKSFRKNELGIFFDKNKRDIQAILTYVDNNISSAKELLMVVGEALRKRGFSLSLPTIVKNMYDSTIYEKKNVVNKRRKTIKKSDSSIGVGTQLKQLSDRNFPRDFVEEMIRRKIPKMFYGDYYEDYLKGKE